MLTEPSEQLLERLGSHGLELEIVEDVAEVMGILEADQPAEATIILELQTAHVARHVRSLGLIAESSHDAQVIIISDGFMPIPALLCHMPFHQRRSLMPEGPYGHFSTGVNWMQLFNSGKVLHCSGDGLLWALKGGDKNGSAPG